MKRLWLHMRELWPKHTLLPGVPLFIWAAFVAWKGMLRWDHIAVAMLVAGLAYTSKRTKQFLISYAGFAGVAWSYDAMRFFRDVGLSESRVLLCQLHAAEQRIFGVTIDGQAMTLQDMFYRYHSVVADVFFAIPYGIYIVVAMGFGVYLYFVDPRACQRYSLAFFALNVIGFVTYHVVPAAPPWYFHARGCVVDLAASSSAGPALNRVDALLGMGYFHSLYGRASEVFGAIPSLHVAYPLLIIFEVWPRHRWKGRAISIVYFSWMCVAAVYLDHHWVIDILLGWTYTIIVYLVMRRLVPPTQPQPPSDERLHQALNAAE